MADALIEGEYQARRQRALERRGRRRARAIVLVAVLSAAALSLWILPTVPKPLPRSVARDGVPSPLVATRDTIGKGQGMVGALIAAGLTRREAGAVLKASELRATARRDIPLALFADSATAPVREVEFQVADDRSVRVMRLGADSWYATERREIWRTDTVTVRAPVSGSLVETMRVAGRSVLGLRGRTETAYALAEAFEYKIDVGRDLRAGDSVVAVVERRRTAFGAERVGPLVAGALFHDREWMRAIRFSTPKGRPEYYDVAGRPMRTTFLAAPVEFRRMSSAFGLRGHPLLGTLRRHAGIDFAAPFGTPVRAVGDGAVIRAAYVGAFGKLVEIRHRDGMVTRYGHLRGFAASLRAGRVVTRGQVIGYVGSTGLSTGPHLHFETLVNGVSREPTRTLREAGGVELKGPSLNAFAVRRDAVAARLGLAPATSSAAAALPAQPTATGSAAPAATMPRGTSVSAPK
jgi:murein DD-endopeptidase MepM/ murein hydrolase activator NlpD